MRACFCLFVEHSQGCKELYLASSHLITDNLSRQAFLDHVTALYVDDGQGSATSRQANSVPWSAFARERIVQPAVNQEHDKVQIEAASRYALSATSFSTRRHTSCWTGPITALSKQLDLSIPLVLHSVLPLAIALYEAQVEQCHLLPSQVSFCLWTSDRRVDWAGVERVRGLALLQRSFRVSISGSDAISTFLRNAAKLLASDDADSVMTSTECELASRYVQFNWRELDSAAAWKTEIADGVQTSSYASPTTNALYAGLIATDKLAIYAAENPSYDEYRMQTGQKISLVGMLKRLLTIICDHAADLDSFRVQNTLDVILSHV
jgi:hypothetical protein